MKQKQPNSRFCFVCGLDNPYGLHLAFYEQETGDIQAEITVPEQFQGYPGMVHGGVIAALLDEVTGRVYMHGDSPRFMVTAKLTIRYRKPVPVGEQIRLVGRPGSDNGRVASATGQIFDSSGTLLAEAEATYMNIPPANLASVDMEAVGWKVYPDGEELA